jgi:hypothetical protein
VSFENTGSQYSLPASELEMNGKLTGIYPGIVESTTDPRILGRCKVRIPTIDGDESSAPTNSLPWARACFPAFMFNPPQVGDAVWVLFQGGDRRYPVYLGWCPANPAGPQVRQRHPGYPSLQYDGITSDDYPEGLENPRQPVDSNQPYAGDEPPGSNTENYTTKANVSEVPPEVLKGPSWDPNVRIFKTWRGHTIVFSDHPEGEYLKIIDRSGQMIFFDCAVQADQDQNNQTPRGGSIEACFEKGIGEADKGVRDGRTQLDISKMRQRTGENNRASIRITDLFGQYLEFWAEEDRPRIRLQSCRQKDDDQTPNHYIEISSSQDPENEYILLETREGHLIKLDETGNQIIIQHKAGSEIVIDPSANIILSTVA